MIRNKAKDIVSLVKKDGQRIDNIRASVQGDKVITFETHHPIEEGDSYERTLPNGVVEHYLIEDAGYYASVGSIPANYQSSVRKRTKIEAAAPVQQNIYNLHGNNSKININSTDSSTNVVNISSDEVFIKLEEAARTIKDDGVQAILLEKIHSMKTAQNKADFTVGYGNFMAAAANHVTVFAPFLPALIQLLSDF